MDIFGIGINITSLFKKYTLNMRNTGRTTLLAKTVKPGDAIIFLNNQHINHFKDRMNSLSLPYKDILMISVSTTKPQFSNISNLQGQLYFDHCWLEVFYKNNHEYAVQFIFNLNKEISK